MDLLTLEEEQFADGGFPPWEPEWFKKDFPKTWEIGKTSGWGYRIGEKYKRYGTIPTVNRAWIANLLWRLYGDKADCKALEINRWFDAELGRCVNRWVEEAEMRVMKNDLFFGVGFMLNVQNMWNLDLKSGRAWHRRVAESDELTWYRKMMKSIKEMPESVWYQSSELQERLTELMGDFAGSFPVNITLAQSYRKKLDHPHGNRFGQEKPNINKEMAVYLMRDLGQKLKNRRDGSNRQKAAELVLELANFFEVRLQDLNRLRRKAT